VIYFELNKDLIDYQGRSLTILKVRQIGKGSGDRLRSPVGPEKRPKTILHYFDTIRWSLLIGKNIHNDLSIFLYFGEILVCILFDGDLMLALNCFCKL